MGQIRIIRISFFICAVLAFIAFGAGFYFGRIDNDLAGMVTENTTDIYEENETASDDENDVDRAVAAKDSDGADILESMTALSPETYYLRKNGNYLSVYRGDSSDVYFETGIRVSDLPEDLQEAAAEGIVFENLEELYGFLENYSS